jgi:hypothetical protein
VLVPGEPSERGEQPIRLAEVARLDLGVGKRAGADAAP